MAAIPQQTWPIVTPSLYETLMRLESEIFGSLYVSEPGQIVTINTALWTAQVQPAFKRVQEDGTVVNRPILPDVPIWIPGGGGAWLQFPIAPGDNGLLVYMDRDMGTWFIQGGQAPPPTYRKHDVSDAVFFPALKPLSTTAPAIPSDRARLISAGGAEVAVTTAGLVSIRNLTTSLLTLMDGLITVMEGIMVQQGMSTLPLTAASIAALEAYKTILAGLLI